MFFNFDILSLLIVFMLLVNKSSKDNYPFNLVLWGSYITQLLYVITSASIESGGNYMLFGRLYFIFLMPFQLL